MFSDMGNEYRGSVCGETRWNIPTTTTTNSFGFSPFFSTASTSDLETFGSLDIKGNFLQCAAVDDDARYNSLQDVPDSDSNVGGYFMDPNLPINSAAAATITDDWTQPIIFNSSGGGGERNTTQSQILQEQMINNSRLNTHDFHGGDSQDPSLKPFNLSSPSTFFLDQIHTPNITYGLFSQQQPIIYENPHELTNMAYNPAASTTNFSTSSTTTHDHHHHHQVVSPPNSPFSPSIFSPGSMTMWNTSTDHHFFPSSSTPAASLIANNSSHHDHNLEPSTSSMTNKSKKKINYNADQQPLTSKKPRFETPSPLPTFKVRKEKMGDRITALQQLVSPFGKTDTASVLHEAIDYIKFLHDQVNTLSHPYLKNGNLMIQHQQRVDLKSRGLCLVPISSTFPVTSETTADFWTPTSFGGAFSR